MARGFGATVGSGTGDKITTFFTAHATLRSYAWWANRNAGGGSGLGRFFEKRVAGAQVESAHNDDGTPRYVYRRQWTNDANWSWARPSTGVWEHYVLTYDAGATGNNPVVYVNGASVTVTTILAPTGSLTTNTDAYVIGNRGNDNARNWDGSLADFAIWDVILDAAEANALGVGVSPVLIRPTSLVFYEPMVRDNSNPLIQPSLVAGTVVQPHPRLWEAGGGHHGRRAGVVVPFMPRRRPVVSQAVQRAANW